MAKPTEAEALAYRLVAEMMKQNTERMEEYLQLKARSPDASLRIRMPITYTVCNGEQP